MIPLDFRYSDLPEVEQIAFEEDFGSIAEMIAKCEDTHSLEILLRLCETRISELDND